MTSKRKRRRDPVVTVEVIWVVDGNVMPPDVWTGSWAGHQRWSDGRAIVRLRDGRGQDGRPVTDVSYEKAPRIIRRPTKERS